ncbi:MAG: hypothetical protein KDA38_06360, partial [Planctomycetales bacterium]|nr:hypothetical protein [Planctomycetales bacterium]
GEAVVRFAEPAATSLAPSDLSRGQSGRVAFVPPGAELSEKPQLPAGESAVASPADASLAEAVRESESLPAGRPTPHVRRRDKPIGEISVTMPSVNAANDGDYPRDLWGESEEAPFTSFGARDFWPTNLAAWEPPRVVHRPLYWDETPLERYGQTRHPVLQPLTSTAHFFGTFFVTPAKLVIEPPLSPATDAGLFRPGSPVPCLRQKPLR